MLEAAARDHIPPFCIRDGQLELAWILFIGNEHVLTLQADVEKHEHFGVEGSGANAVVVSLKEAQLLVPAILCQ